MKAKSILLTVPLAVSALTVLTLPANAVCWSWKPCADMQGYGYGYGVTTESQSVLPPLPPDGSVPPGTAACGRQRSPLLDTPSDGPIEFAVLARARTAPRAP